MHPVRSAAEPIGAVLHAARRPGTYRGHAKEAVSTVVTVPQFWKSNWRSPARVRVTITSPPWPFTVSVVPLCEHEARPPAEAEVVMAWTPAAARNTTHSGASPPAIQPFRGGRRMRVSRCLRRDRVKREFAGRVSA